MRLHIPYSEVPPYCKILRTGRFRSSPDYLCSPPMLPPAPLQYIYLNQKITGTCVVVTMPSTSPSHALDISGPSGNNAANLQDLWEQALITLSAEDRKQFGEPSSSMIDVLNGVCKWLSVHRAQCVSLIDEAHVYHADLRLVD